MAKLKNIKVCPQCGKECYERRWNALQVVRSILRRKHSKASIYECRACGYYHITHYSYSDSKDIRQGLIRNKKLW